MLLMGTINFISIVKMLQQIHVVSKQIEIISVMSHPDKAKNQGTKSCL